MPATDEDIIRDLLHRYTDHVHPPASIATEVVARQRRRDRRRIVSLAATGAAVGTAAGVIAVVPGHSSPAPTGSSASGQTQPAIRLTADQRELYHLSSAAARQPHDQGQGRYAVMSTVGTDVKDTSVIDSRTGNMWSYQQGSHGYPSTKGIFTRRYSPTAAQFAAMPTGRAALRAALITQWKSEHKSRPHRFVAKGPKGTVTLVPRPVTVSYNDMVFQQASNLLWYPLVSPALRAALYKVLADVPGVTVNRAARDSLGKRAVEISRTDTSGLPGGTDGITYATYEKPATGATLESTITYPPGTGPVTPQDTAITTDITIYLGTSWTSTIPGDPYGG